MRKNLLLLAVVFATVGILFGCATDSAHHDALDVPIPEAVQEFYINFLESVKTDRYTAVHDYCHFEEEEYLEATASAPNLEKYEIISWKKLSDSLWEVETKQYDEIFKSGCYGVNYIGIIDGRYYVITGLSQIPAELTEGVEIVPYKPHGDDIVDESDIVGEFGNLS